MSLVLADEKRAREEFLSLSERQNTAEANADRKKLTLFTRRLAELDKLIGAVYEDKVLGKRISKNIYATTRKSARKSSRC